MRRIMPFRLEIAQKLILPDAEGKKIQKKAKEYFNIHLSDIRTIDVIIMDVPLTDTQLSCIQTDLFTNPVTQNSSYAPLPIPFDFCVWVGYRPGVRDNPGSTATEAIQDLLGISFDKNDGVYTSKRYCFSGASLTKEQITLIAQELLANDIIQQWKIFSKAQWDMNEGIGLIIPKVQLNHTPTVSTIPIDSCDTLFKISQERNLALNPKDIPVIRDYFIREDVIKERQAVNLSDPTDVELEYISQARSDHCNHNTFNAIFHYTDHTTNQTITIDNLFKTYIVQPTRLIQAEKDWVISVLWDNAGVGKLNDDYFYVITGETHNSPSNMEAYGGAITGIVGVYRDPLGTGKGAKLVMGAYGFCVGPRDYEGELKPKLHPRRLLDGIIEGVRDGGNKSGIPTPFGHVLFHQGYMGKCLVFVTAVGIMPASIHKSPSDQKITSNGDIIFMCGGRVGKDGIHGVTASSEIFTEHTPAGHVQIGDPYTQKKMHDFLLEARDEGLIAFITDNGGGGLSSSIGESARFSNGCIVHLDKVPLKYEGLDYWEIWISESQERMTVAVKPDHKNRFLELSHKHNVESTAIGTFTHSGKLHIMHHDQTCAFVNMDLLQSGFPQWEFQAEWRSPENRGMTEPVVTQPKLFEPLLKRMLSQPNICSKEWIIRQYDHEVQGTSVIKPLVGVSNDVNSDATVIRPVLSLEKGLALSQAALPFYSAIDAYHMTTCTIDEAIRRVIAVGANPNHISGVDNFCWPSIQYDAEKNPDGKHKAAQLVRSCMALKDMCLAYRIPLLSGKDSMYVDGHLQGPYGETRKISALETLQFSTLAHIESITTCTTMDVKYDNDLVYIIGETRPELGGSEYYHLLGYIGVNVPNVFPERFFKRYCALAEAIQSGVASSVHGVYRGGLGVHLALCAMAGQKGMTIDLRKCHRINIQRDDFLLFSETPGRFIVTISPQDQTQFEKIMHDYTFSCIGFVASTHFKIIGLQGHDVINSPVNELRDAWKKPFSDLI